MRNEKGVLRKAGRVGTNMLTIRKADGDGHGDSQCQNCDAPTNDECGECGMDICEPDSHDGDCSTYKDGKIDCLECKAERAYEDDLQD